MAHSYTDTPSPHPAPHALGSLCPFSLSRKCASTFQKPSLRSNHTPTLRSSKLDTNVKISTNLGKKCGLRYNVSSTWRVRSWDPHRHPHLPLLYTSTNPTDFLSGSSCRKRLSRCPKAFRLCEYAQDVHSCPMALRLCCTPHPPPHLPPPPLPSTPAEAIQLRPKAGTFNLTECSRHLNYLTAVLVQGGGHRG